jgi:hypothetical protein
MVHRQTAYIIVSLRTHVEAELGQLRQCSTSIATTQPTTQNNLKQLLLGWYYYRLKKNAPPHNTTTPPHHTTPGLITIRAVLGNLGISAYNLIFTQLDKIRKTT